MSNVLTPVDVYAIVNDAAVQMFGSQTMKAIDTSTFVSVGETMLRTSYENTLNALSMTLARTFFAVRPYKAKFNLVTETAEMFGNRVRKISYFYDSLEPSNDWNTDLLPEQLKDGNSIDHYKIRKRYPLEMNFYGIKTLQKSFTRFRKQLRLAFQNEAEFSRYYQGLATEIQNELEIKVESENRLLLLNYIGELYNAGGRMSVNLAEEYNTEYGTSFTVKQLLTDELKSFLAFAVAYVKKTMDYMTDISTLYHVTPTKTNDAGNNLVLLRHTPKADQRFLSLSSFWINAQANVLPEIFNDEYLKLNQGERVNYWQSPEDPGKIMLSKINTIDATGVSHDVTTAITIPYVLGVLFDRDALMVNYKVTDVLTTPVNANGDYYNTVYHWAKQYCSDITENGVLFYMADKA